MSVPTTITTSQSLKSVKSFKIGTPRCFLGISNSRFAGSLASANVTVKATLSCCSAASSSSAPSCGGLFSCVTTAASNLCAETDLVAPFHHLLSSTFRAWPSSQIHHHHNRISLSLSLLPPLVIVSTLSTSLTPMAPVLQYLFSS